MTSSSGLLEGKLAVVTGASRRIGRAVALGLAAEGADLVVHARSARDEVEAVADEVRALGVRALVQLADVSDETQVAAMAARIDAEFGRVDVLVNNAAVRRQSPFTDMSFSEWREIVGVILDGTFLCSRALLPLMLRDGGGAIVNLGGVSAHIGTANRAHVAAAKAGVTGLTRALAVEFAERGITVNCVAPGKIGGKRSATAGQPPPLPGGARIPVGREGTVEEAAAMVCMLCLPTSRFVTGQTIHVSGGLHLT